MWGKLVRVGWLTWLLLPHLYAEPRARKALVTTISSEQVAEALASRGVRVRPAQIQFLSAVPSTINPKLQMVSMGPTAFTSMSAKLRCSTGECLPFYVLLRGLTDIQDRDAAGPTTRVVPLGQLNTPEHLVRRGQRGTLVLETGTTRITMPVVCLESGAGGQKIRVSSTDHKRVYDGEVVGPGMLKGSL